MTALTLAHLSDPHLAPLPQPRLRELMGKRALGYLNWKRNRHLRHARRVVDDLTADLRAQAIDHVAVTGDLINLGLEAEFGPARDWLHALGAPHDITLIPGNHDAYVRETYPRCTALWSDYMQGDDGARSSAAPFPFTRRRGDILLIGASSAVPTAPFMATGCLGREQIETIATRLSDPAAQQCFRILLVHHPLRSNPNNWYKRLTDAQDLLAMLSNHRVDLILHGHDHKHSLMWFDGPDGQIPAVGVPSAAAVIDGKHDPAAYNLFRIAREGENWRCDWTVRGFQDGRDGISEISRQRLI